MDRPAARVLLRTFLAEPAPAVERPPHNVVRGIAGAFAAEDMLQALATEEDQPTPTPPISSQ